MNKNKRNIIISIILTIVAITYTILVKVVDVKPVGMNNTNIGFSSINTYFSNLIGKNMFFYNLTEITGVIAILVACIYACIGLLQLIKRKSLKKVDKEIFFLGILYALVIVVYALFEKVIINYRPVLIDGVLEASYPSSHTLLTVCVCGSSIMINKQLFQNKITKIGNILLYLILIVTVLGRFASGVHWFTDIIGGLLISSALLMIYYTSINYTNSNKRKRRSRRR